MGTSTTTPPSGTTADPVPSLYLSDTFYTWFNTTNDVINKVNPIEVYTLRAATGGYNSNSIAAAYGSTTGIGGVTIDDLGNGNFKLGYIIPEKVTGGHTWYGHNDFKSGPSGHIANSFCGRTGEIIGANTVSGRMPVVSGGTGNITGCVIEINGLLATEGGTISITAGDIEGSLASSTGPAGYIITATGGYEMDAQTKLFDGIPDNLQGTSAGEQYQNALLIHGASGGSSGNRPAIAVGGQSCDASYGLLVDGGAWYGGGTQGGVKFKGNNKANNFDISAVGSLHVGACADIIMNIDHVADNSAEFKVTSSTTANGTPSQIENLMRVDASGELYVDKIRGVDDSANMIDLSGGSVVKINKTLHVNEYMKDSAGKVTSTYKQDYRAGTDSVTESGFVLRPDTTGKMTLQDDYLISSEAAPNSSSTYTEGTVWYQIGGAGAGAGVANGNKMMHISMYNNTEITRQDSTPPNNQHALRTPVRAGITPWKNWTDLSAGDLDAMPAKSYRGWEILEIGTSPDTAAYAIQRVTRPESDQPMGNGSGLNPIGVDLAGSHCKIKLGIQFGIQEPLNYNNLTKLFSSWAVHPYTTTAIAPFEYKADGWSNTDQVEYAFLTSYTALGSGYEWAYQLDPSVYQSRFEYCRSSPQDEVERVIFKETIEMPVYIGNDVNTRLFICLADERGPGNNLGAVYQTDHYQIDELIIDAYALDV